jgi:hypothetical protein
VEFKSINFAFVYLNDPLGNNLYLKNGINSLELHGIPYNISGIFDNSVQLTECTEMKKGTEFCVD